MKTLPSERIRLLSCGLGLLLAGIASAQVPDSPSPAPAPAAKPAQGGSGGGQKDGSFLGKDVPGPDPGSETITWGGKTWNVNNNRIFEARFEKYLNAPEETTRTAQNYQLVITKILSLLAPGNATVQNVDAAFGLLPRGSSYDIDAHLCDSLADAVYSAWRAQNAENRLETANESLEREKTQQYWNAQHASAGEDAEANASGGNSGASTKGGGQKTQSGL
jgi:hypothetical protein